MNLRLLVSCLGLLLAAPSGFAGEAEPDVLVYGATPSGIAAATSAAKAGRRVTLVEPTDRIGGMVTHGLSYSDFRSFEALSGFFQRFAEHVEAYYRDQYGRESQQLRDCFRGVHGEPSVNLQVLENMLAEDGVQVRRRLRLTGVESAESKLGRRMLQAAVFQDTAGARVRIAARQFIDATYEGDLMAAAGEPFHVGREAREQYGEPLAGDALGRADGQVQGYNFRLIMTRRAENRLMPVAPPGYRREDFVGALQHFQSGRLTRVFASGREGIFRAHEPSLPNEKADVNDTPRSPVRLSLPDLNDAYPTASPAAREAIVQRHFYENIGLLYFLQNDPEVPEAVRTEAAEWGFCRDEFTGTGGVPGQLYVREARRMIGQHVFTIRDTRQAARDARTVLQPGSIAIGDYVHNCHGTGRRGTRYEGEHEGEFYDNVQPYQIRYGVIVPAHTANLLVPVACSASHFGFSALRLEPIWSSLGQAAGWAAHLALQHGTPVQEVAVDTLQEALHRDRSATVYVSDVASDAPEFRAVQWFGTRGAFHGLVNLAVAPPAPERIVGQYTRAFPLHAVELAAPLTDALRERWSALLPAGVPAPREARTRGEWLQEAFNRLERRAGDN